MLTACKNVHIRHPKEHVPYSLYIPGEDHENYDLSVHFDSAINFIHQSRKETNILVHCMAGVSRSVTLVLAYLIKHFGMSYNEAFRTVQRKRNKVTPVPYRSTQILVLFDSSSVGSKSMELNGPGTVILPTMRNSLQGLNTIVFSRTRLKPCMRMRMCFVTAPASIDLSITPSTLLAVWKILSLETIIRNSSKATPSQVALMPPSNLPAPLIKLSPAIPRIPG